ncbi:MAG TPA: hypothetical protein VE219_05040, partial [Candidatus Sulfotelmatobacter sp.]|nr:hypothetical protein [Candidatus Sulfotelmatobacter sp.]
MEAADVLDEAAVERALGDRPKRFYPALISTESDAIAWAASGGPEGAVVVAGHAITPRGHGERPWVLKPEKSVLFTFIVRPNLPPLKAGLLYMVGVSGIADVLGEGTTIEWPADVYRGDVLAGAVGVRTSSDPGR